jgi:hypothetical protein
MGSFYNRGTGMAKKQRFNKDGTPDKRYGKKKAKPVSHIQDIIDSQKAPGVHIAAHHQATWKPGMPDPHEPLDWSERTERGADWGKDRPENQRGYRNPEL